MRVGKECCPFPLLITVKSGVDPLPFCLTLEQKMLGFSQVLKPIKWLDLLGKEKMTTMRFEQVQRFILAKKIFWGYGYFKTQGVVKTLR